MKRKHFIISLIISLLFCLPYFISNQINIGSDTCFHMNRIESLLQALKNGVFYPYVLPNQNYYYGYGSPLFYSILPLYPIVLLRAFGLSIFNSWVISIFLTCFLASLTIQYTLEKIVKNPNSISLFFVSYLYIHSVYRYTKVFKVGALQEFIAIIILPLVFVCIKEALFDNKNNYIKLGLSFSLLLLIHNLSFLLMCVVFAAILLFNIKILTKEKIIIITKGTILAILLTSFFTLPMFEQTKMGIFLVNGYSNNQLVGINLKELISIYTDNFSLDSGIGLGLLLIPLFLLNNKKHRYLAITGYAIVTLSLDIFWRLTSLNFGLLQFTTRLLSIALLFLSLASAIVINDCKKMNSRSIVITVSLILSICSNTYTQYKISTDLWGAINPTTSSEDIKNNDFAGYHDSIYSVIELSTPDYLTSYFDNLDYRDFYYNGFPWGYYSLDSYGVISKNIDNPGPIQIIPKQFYKGYEVTLLTDNNNIKLIPYLDESYSSLLQVDIPKEYQESNITLVVKYSGTTLQKVSAAISIITLVYLLYSLIKKRMSKHSL